MRVIASVVCCLFLLSGCSFQKNSLDQVITMRRDLQECNGCVFNVVITADYGEEVYSFGMDCEMDGAGTVDFTVMEPRSIAGISGCISNEGGAITFENTVLAFQTIADDLITPVTAPWVLMQSLRSGYLKGCSESDDGFSISIDDSYKENALYLNVQTDKNVHPVFAEIYWQGRRILSIIVEDFAFL